VEGIKDIKIRVISKELSHGIDPFTFDEKSCVYNIPMTATIEEVVTKLKQKGSDIIIKQNILLQERKKK